MNSLNIDETTDKLVTIAMWRAGGVKAKAAALLGISERSIHRIIEHRVKNDEPARFAKSRNGHKK